MRTINKVVSRGILIPIAPIALLLAGWWGSLPAFRDGPAVALFAFSGLAVGLALDATVFRRRVDSLFAMTNRGLLLVAIFYSIGMYGFFMGFPAFHPVIGVVGGYVVARRAVTLGWARERALRDARTVAIAMAWVLGALCAITAALALNEATMGTQLQHMLGLAAPVSWPQIYAIIGVGSAGLLVLQYVATILVARRFAPR